MECGNLFIPKSTCPGTVHTSAKAHVISVAILYKTQKVDPEGSEEIYKHN